jgi:transcriptional regulator with XRE-family HTH domain
VLVQRTIVGGRWFQGGGTVVEAARGGGPAEAESIGALLVRLRLAQGRSQLRLAEQLCAASGVATLTRHEISRWEREERIPSGGWLRWLAFVLDASLEELEHAAAHARVRRGVDVTGQTDPGAGGVRPGRPGPEQRAAPDPRRSDDAAGARERLLALRRMDDLVGGAELAGLVHRELRAAQEVAGPAGGGRSPSRTVRERHRVVAELAQLASWVAADAGAPVVSLATHTIGLRAAVVAGDRPLAGHLVASLAQVLAEEGPGSDPVRAFELARAARVRAGAAASAGARALLELRVAFAAARAGAQRTGEESVVAAWRCYARREPEREPDWLYWLDEAHFAALCGRCCAVLGRHRHAVPLLTRALTGRRPGPRPHPAGVVQLRAGALTSAALATAHADAGDLDAACAAASDALVEGVRAGSVRAARAVRAVRDRLRAAAGGGAPPRAVREFLHLCTQSEPFLPAGGDAGRDGTRAGRRS